MLEIDYNIGTPYTQLEFFPGYNFSGVFQQDCEDFEGLALQFDLAARFPQLTGLQVGLKKAETYPG
jgi:hypothetical protein